MAVPLLTTSFTVGDALGDFTFSGALVDSEGGYRLVRRKEIFNRRVIDAIELENLPLPFADSVVVINLAAAGLALPVERLTFASGTLRLIPIFTTTDPVNLKVIFPGLRGMGVDSFVAVTTVTANTPAPATFDLGGLTLDLGTDRIIRARYEARLPDGSVAVPQFLIASFEDLRLREAVGSLADYPYPLGSESIDTEFLSAFVPGTATVRDASVTFEVESTASLPILVTADSTYGALRDGTRLTFATPLDDGILVAPPPAGDTTRTSLVLDETNSGLIEAVRQFPDSLVFVITATANPGGDQTTYTVTDGQRIRGTFLFDIPLSVGFDGFVVTQDFSFGELGEDLDRVEDLVLRVATRSELGIEALAQVYLLGADSLVVDSLLAGDTELVSAQRGPDGTLLTDIPLPRETLSAVRASRGGRVELKLFTPGGEPSAELRASDKVALAVGLAFTIRDPE